MKSFIELVKNLAYAKTIHEEWSSLAVEADDHYDPETDVDEIPVNWDRYCNPGQYYRKAVEAVNDWFSANAMADLFDEDTIFESESFQRYEDRLEAVRKRFEKRLRKSRIWRQKSREEREQVLW